MSAKPKPKRKPVDRGGFIAPQTLTPKHRDEILAALPLKDPATAHRAIEAIESVVGNYLTSLDSERPNRMHAVRRLAEIGGAAEQLLAMVEEFDRVERAGIKLIGLLEALHRADGGASDAVVVDRLEVHGKRHRERETLSKSVSCFLDNLAVSSRAAEDLSQLIVDFRDAATRAATELRAEDWRGRPEKEHSHQLTAHLAIIFHRHTGLLAGATRKSDHTGDDDLEYGPFRRFLIAVMVPIDRDFSIESEMTRFAEAKAASDNR